MRRAPEEFLKGLSQHFNALSERSSTLALFSLTSTTSAFSVHRWIGSDCSCFWRAAPVGQAPLVSSDGNSEHFKQLRISRFDSASQDLSLCLLRPLFAAIEVFPKYDKLSAQFNFLNKLGHQRFG